MWPRDAHRCEIEVGSWTHHGEQIDLQLAPNANDSGVSWPMNILWLSIYPIDVEICYIVMFIYTNNCL